MEGRKEWRKGGDERERRKKTLLRIKAKYDISDEQKPRSCYQWLLVKENSKVCTLLRKKTTSDESSKTQKGKIFLLGRFFKTIRNIAAFCFLPAHT